MQDLIKQEQFEIEVLDRLNTKRFLQNLVFCGGTMMRLCWELDRYSVDLDFWIINNMDFGKLFKDLKTELSQYYKVTDSANKYHTIVFELKTPAYPRSLKVEIRKEQKKIKIENTIAFSKFSNIQVLIKAVSLEDMMNAKIQAFLSRKEIRDIYDIEFMFKRGIPIETEKENLHLLLKGIEALTKKDYTVKLGSLLEANHRKYYTENNFIILRRYLLSLL
ncbi:MAG TPA: nucleotidyl transferase AbiEii/AbiGii toxin family protein [Ignavibacteria bacterium]